MNAAEQKREYLSLRIPTDLYERLQSDAKDHERSLNKEMTVILRDHFKRQQAEEAK